VRGAGALPPLGQVPDTMVAQAIKQQDLGRPKDAFRLAEVDTPRPGRGQVLIAVMAAGINYNNVWAAQGIPVDVIALRQRKGEPHDFHIGGSDASGIVYAVGDGVTTAQVGDEVITHPGVWRVDDPWITDGRDPMLSPTARIWGYDTNFGSFGQFCVVDEHQCLPKAKHLSWAEAAAPTLVGTTAYRMLHGWSGNVVKKDDVVLVWGGAGGVGSQAIQLAKLAGAHPIAVVGDMAKAQYCTELGAVGVVDRTAFSQWGVPPHWTDSAGQRTWTREAQGFGRAIWEALGDRKNPDIVVEHPGESTVPTSVFVCETGGMVVICAGTTGYSATVDLRYHWTRQKRLQGSHGTNDLQAQAYNDLVIARLIDPCLGSVVSFDQIGSVHQDMLEGRLPNGNAVALVGANNREDGRQDSQNDEHQVTNA
jgi:crotonyl-CoA carboxylase/reductase